MNKTILLASVATATSMSFATGAPEATPHPLEQSQSTRTYPRRNSRVNLIPLRDAREEEESTSVSLRQGIRFEVRLQQNKDWYELCTRLHLRDSVNVHLFIPLPEDYQAICDECCTRSSDTFYELTIENRHQVEHITKVLNIEGEDCCVRFDIEHKPTGIDIKVFAEECQLSNGKELTFEIHNFALRHRYLVSYDGRTIAAEPIPAANLWVYLSRTACAETFKGSWNDKNQKLCCTHTSGAVTSAFADSIAGYSAKYLEEKPA
ncbi:MAG: hypothetical protein KBT12_06905 [Bacteroidales bacterium]|nr:hypothetical protein [Candidatus Physcousia equi]